MRRVLDEMGAALIEAAILLPFILLLALGVVDLGRAFHVSAAVQEAAQEGVIYASFNPDDPTGAIARAEDAIQSPDITGSVTVTCPTSDQVTVTVAHTFNLITPLISRIAGDSINLTHAETGQVLSTTACIPSP